MSVVTGRLDPDDFTDRNVDDPRIQDLMRRIRHVPQAGSIVVTLKGGARLTEPAGHPGDLTEWSEIIDKFRRCCAAALDFPHIEKAIELVRDLEGLSSVRQLAAALKRA
jgi:2-methylcitrate dehydratase PrpD